MSPEGLTSHIYNYCSYVLNITSFLFPSDVIYLGGWIKKYLALISTNVLNFHQQAG